MALTGSDTFENPRSVGLLVTFGFDLVSSSMRFGRDMSLFEYLCSRNGEVVRSVGIPFFQYIEYCHNREQVNEDKTNLNKKRILGLMEESEGSKAKCEKRLPFRKRFHKIYSTEKGTPGSSNLSNAPTSSASTGRQETKATRSADESNSPSTSRLPSDARTKEEISFHQNPEGNFQTEFENLHLLADVTSESGAADLGAGSCIPVTVESIPSTSTSITKKSPFTCSFCQKKFNHKGDMNKHLRSHTKEQPYKCTYCSLKFSHTSNLQRHLRIHTGSKPHSCEHCNRTFSRIDKLHLHQKHEVCGKNKTN